MECFRPAREASSMSSRAAALRRRYKPGDRPPQPQRTFQNTWRARCEDDWLRAFYMFSFSAHPNYILRVHRASQSTCAMPIVCMHRGFDADDILCMCNMLHSCHSGEQGQHCWVKEPGAGGLQVRQAAVQAYPGYLPTWPWRPSSSSRTRRRPPSPSQWCWASAACTSSCRMGGGCATSAAATQRCRAT